MGRYTDVLWERIAGIYESILAHPFLEGLTDGSLDEGAFRHYVIQDAHYLREYARALAVVGARAHEDTAIAMFARHAAGAIDVERELHAELLAALDIDPDEASATPVAPTTLAYTSYLLATAHGGSYPEGVGAVLPCYWIYGEVGRALVDRGSPDPRFQRWIDTYAGDEFDAIVREVLAETDRIGGGLTDEEARRVGDHVVTTSRYEWMFWDAAWRREAWPDLG